MTQQTQAIASTCAPYLAMCRESTRAGWPRAYHADLHTHDRRRMEGPDAPAFFVWVLREHGTLLLDATMSNADARAYFAHLRGCRDGSRLFIWEARNGAPTLREVSHNGASDYMEAHADNGPTRY